MYNINRRKFLGLFGCGCCSIILPSCSTVPITERKQLTIIPEYKINAQASKAYEQFKSKAKLMGERLVSLFQNGEAIPEGDPSFWKSDAAQFIKEQNNRKGKSRCQPRVSRHLASKYCCE